MNYYKDPPHYYAVRKKDILHVNTACNIISLLDIDFMFYHVVTDGRELKEIDAHSFELALEYVTGNLKLNLIK